MSIASELRPSSIGTRVASKLGWILRGVPQLTPQALGFYRVFLGVGLFIAVGLHLRPPAADLPRDLHIGAGFFADSWLAHSLAENVGLLSPIYVVTLVAIAFFSLGLLTRAALGVAITGIALHVLAGLQGSSQHEWGLPLLTFLFLLPIPWGDAFSVDASIRRLRGKPPTGPLGGTIYGFALWLPRLTLGLAWGSAAVTKIRRSGFEYISGGAVKYHFVEDAFRAPLDVGTWIATHPEVAVAVTALGVAAEAFFFLNIFVKKEGALLWLFGATGAGLLAGFYIFQGVLWLPWWVLLLVFLPWQRLYDSIAERVPEYAVFLDLRCGVCRRTGRFLQAFDWFGKLKLEDANDEARFSELAPSVSQDQALIQMHVIRLDESFSGRVTSGYRGFVQVSRSIPVLWPLVPVLALPPIRGLGESIYRRVAEHRDRQEHANSCGLSDAAAPSHISQRANAAKRQARYWPVYGGLIVILVLQQGGATVAGAEHEPFISTFPMYSHTYASTEEFNKQLVLNNSRYQFVDPQHASDDVDLLPRIREVSTRGPEVVVDAFLSLSLANESGRSCGEVQALASDYRNRFGRSLRQLEIFIDAAFFDWSRGRFGWKPTAELGILNIDSCEAVSTSTLLTEGPASL